jgi:hypothetical protein
MITIHKKWKYSMHLDWPIGSSVLDKAPVLLDEALASEKLSTSILAGPLLVGCAVPVHWNCRA